MATITPKRFKQGNITTGRTVTRTYYQKKTGTYVTKTYTYSKTPTRQSQNIFKKNGEFKKKALTRRRYFGILPKSAKRHGPLAQLVRATGS